MKVGDLVEWESQAAAYWTTKAGKIVAIVPDDVNPLKTGFGRKAYYENTHRIMFDGGYRPHKSYLVEVPGGKTAKAMPKLYWPRVNQLKLVKL